MSRNWFMLPSSIVGVTPGVTQASSGRHKNTEARHTRSEKRHLGWPGVTRDLLACLGLLLAALVLHRDGLFGGPAFYERDTQLFYYPLANWVSEQLHAGIYPRWLPGIFTGYPIYADGELGLLYPPQVALLALLPTAEAMVWLRVLHAFLAGTGMLVFLRTLRLGTLAGLGGGLVFAFGSFVTAQMHHENVVRSAVWLPFVLTAAELALRSLSGRRRVAWVSLGGLAFALSATGLHVQPVLMLALALVAYVGYRVVLGPAEVPTGRSDAQTTPAERKQAAGPTAPVGQEGGGATQQGPAGWQGGAPRTTPAGQEGGGATQQGPAGWQGGAPRTGPAPEAATPGRSATAQALPAAQPTPDGATVAQRRRRRPHLRLARWVDRPPGRFVLVAGGIGLGGLTLAAAQWLPLAEWALVSFRRGGVDYTFASAFELAPQSLPTLLFPYFFRLPDGSTWWSLWQQWETELYVGIPTLALMLVGVVGSHRREVFFFLPLGAAALLVGMAAAAPVLNLHLLLWSVPGFSFLRAPARFTYLVVFASAGLAALGVEALAQRQHTSRWSRRPRLVVALVGAAPAVGLLAAMLALLPSWRTALLADPAAARRSIEASYLSARAQYPIDPDLVYRGLLASLDLTNPKTAWSLVLLALTAVLFVVWLALGRRRAWLGQALLVSLMSVDLLVFAADFHPRAPLASLSPAPLPGVSAGDRVVLDGPESLPDVEPNQLLLDGVSTVGGYSSLPSQRHVELLDQTQEQPALLEVWSERYVIEPTQPMDGHSAGGVSFRADHPIAASFGDGLPSNFVAPSDTRPIAAVRVVGTLSYAFDVPQGTQVAELDVGDVRLPLRAGIEMAERAFDRPSLQGLLAHSKPPGPTALDFQEVTPEGEAYTAHLYLADLALPQPTPVTRLTLTASLPRVLVQVHGIGLVSTDGSVRSLDLADREGFRLAAQDEQHRVVEHVATLPRAFVVPRANGVSPGRHPDLTPVQMVASPDFDPTRDVLIEGDPSAGQAGGESGQPQAAEITDEGPERVEVRASTDRPSYLVLDDFYHRGWTARVDGQATRVFIANAVFRAVALEPGQHVVEFRFEPLSHVVGAGISAVALLSGIGLLVWGGILRR